MPAPKAISLEGAPAASGATLGDASVGDAAQEVELSSALREETTIGGEAAGDRLRRLFAERRERGMGMVRDKFNDGGAISAGLWALVFIGAS